MNFKKLITTPTIIASIVVLISYLFLPMWSNKQVNRDGDTKVGVSVSGLQILTSSVSLDGDRLDDASAEDKREAKVEVAKSIYTKKRGCDTCNPILSLFDKLTIFILLGALFLIFGPVMKSLDKDIPFLNERNMNVAKKILLIITGIFFVRYGFSIDMNPREGIIPRFNWGMYIMLVATIFIAYENKIMTVVSKQIEKK
ncbi:hypothetical protein N8010_02825 [Crocinitomicaceae bacterium]|nr:hypothetical protein [Crocinitomicaceae bacterium]MDC1196274.1 hypothetical protein [Crocinitomicaceae bacterium]